jgi:hypothetical protein
VNLVDPRGLETRDWVDYTADNLSSFVRVMKIADGSQWREWGDHVRQSLRSRGILVPQPDQFDDWEEWAIRFNQVIEPL